MSMTVAGESVGAHIRRTNLVPLSHDSSTLMTKCVGGEEKQPDSSKGIILTEYYCLETRQRSLLLCTGTVLASR